MSDESTAVIDSPAATETSAPASSAPATSSPSPAVTSSNEATAPEFKASPRNADEGAVAYIQRQRAEREAFEKGEQAAPEAKPVEAAKPAETKPAEPAKPAVDAVVDPTKEDELTPDVPVDIGKLSEAMKANPEEFEKACATLGITKNDAFAMARQAHKAQEFIKEFPGGFEEVKFVKQHAAEREALETGFTGISSVQDAGAFLREVVMPMSYVLDENGQPLKDEAGNIQTDGTVNRFIDNIVNLGMQLQPEPVFQNLLALPQGKELLLKHIASLASDDDDELKAALEIVKDRQDKRGSSSAASEPQTEQQKKLAADRQQIDAEKQSLAQQRQAEQTQRDTDNERAVATSISSEVNSLIDSILAKFAIPDFNKESAKEKIRNALYERINEDQAFKMQAAQLARKQYGTKSHQERVGLAKRTAKSYAWTIADPIIKQAGGELIAANKAKHDKITTQVDASRKEPKAGLTTPGAPQKLSTADIGRIARENIAKNGGDASDTKVLLQEMKRVQAGQ